MKKNKIKVFGPNKFAAQLEGSKAFMKNICKEYKIPTAGFKICTNKKNSANRKKAVNGRVKRSKSRCEV